MGVARRKVEKIRRSCRPRSRVGRSAAFAGQSRTPATPSRLWLRETDATRSGGTRVAVMAAADARKRDDHCPGSLAHPPSSRRGAVVVVQAAEHGNRYDRAGERRLARVHRKPESAGRSPW